MVCGRCGRSVESVVGRLYDCGNIRVVRKRLVPSRVRVLMDVPPGVDMSSFVKCLGKGDTVVVFSGRTGLGCGFKGHRF